MIEAISRGCKGTLSDGTLRYVVDISPKDAAAAAELFGMPGSPVVLARLTQEAAIQSARVETIDKPVVKESLTSERLKGGELAKWAGILCRDMEFEAWLSSVYPREYVGCLQDGATWIREKCDIDSRSELDHNKDAATIFRDQIMAPFAEWKNNQQIEDI